MTDDAWMRGIGAAQLIDLTMPIRHGMDAFPGEPTASFTPFSSLDDGGIEMWNVSIFSQLGTHVDAPRHFVEDGATVERMSLSSCVGPAVVIDVEGSTIQPAHLAEHTREIRHHRRVLFRTGWSKRYGQPEFWTDFPELTMPSVDALVALGVRFVGLDTPTPSLAKVHETHHRLLGADIVLTECLTNLDKLSRVTFLVCLPLPLVGLDGSPARVIAIEMPTDTEDNQ